MPETGKKFTQHALEWLSAIMAFALVLPLPLWCFRVLIGVLDWLMLGEWKIISWCTLTDERVCVGETKLIGLNKIISFTLQADMLFLLPLVSLLLLLCSIAVVAAFGKGNH